MSKERSGYPTQKPLALLERIIEAHSEPGDTVADLFCGSGTTLVAAEKLGRRWIGCDVGEQSLRVCKERLERAIFSVEMV
jgi:site-specific DNA-methyltransferase (adenine-specific)/adenine-specific DNA-methyltransferase